MKSVGLWRFWIAACLFTLACSNSNGAATDGGGMMAAGGGSSGGAPLKIAAAPTGGSVYQFVADADGVVISFLSVPSSLVTVSPTGQVTTIFSSTATSPDVNYVAMDAQTVYFTGTTTLHEASGLYSVPRAGGGSATPLYTTSDVTITVQWAVADTNSVYVAANVVPASYVKPDAGPPVTASTIVQIAKSSGTATTIYATPDNQRIDNLFIDGSTLYWSEQDARFAHGPTVIRSGTLGGATLGTTTVATLQSPYNAAALVETNGTIVYSTLNTTDSSTGTDGGITISGTTYIFGLFAITAGAAQPTLANQYGTTPIAVNPGVVYFNDNIGVNKADVSGSGVGAATKLSHTLATQIAGDGHGSVYYINFTDNGIYKL